VAVNLGDDQQTVRKYLEENHFSFPVVLAGDGPNPAIARDYGIQAFPTNYLVDANGKVVWRSLGFDEEGLRKAIAAQGVK